VTEELKEYYAKDKSAYVRPPGNSAHISRACSSAQELKNKPQPKKKIRRDFPYRKKEKKGYQGQYLRPGEENEICAHYTGDRAAGPDGRDLRIRIGCKMHYAGRKTAKQIEEEISYRTDLVFDIVTKDVERPHIAEEMKNTSVQKHEGNQREKLFFQCKMERYAGNEIAGRHQTVLIHKLV
jgi:hypothetical protein